MIDRAVGMSVEMWNSDSLRIEAKPYQLFRKGRKEMKKSILVSIVIALAMIVCSSLASAQMTPVFGPKQYTRASGPP